MDGRRSLRRRWGLEGRLPGSAWLEPGRDRPTRERFLVEESPLNPDAVSSGPLVQPQANGTEARASGVDFPRAAERAEGREASASLAKSDPRSLLLGFLHLLTRVPLRHLDGRGRKLRLV